MDLAHGGPLSTFLQALFRPRGDRRWDFFIRGTGVAGLIGIPIALWMPGAVPLVWLAVVGIPANGPLSPILPTTFDPLLMEVGKYSPVLLVTLVALGVYMYMEYVNWYVYAWVLNWDRLEGVRSNRAVRWGVDRFGRAPTSTTIFFAVTPLPFWVARSLAILHKFSLRRFMVATAIGRFPRFFVYAWLGAFLAVPTWIIVVVIVGGAATAIGLRLLKGEKVLADTGLNGTPASDRAAESPPA